MFSLSLNQIKRRLTTNNVITQMQVGLTTEGMELWNKNDPKLIVIY